MSWKQLFVVSLVFVLCSSTSWDDEIDHIVPASHNQAPISLTEDSADEFAWTLAAKSASAAIAHPKVTTPVADDQTHHHHHHHSHDDAAEVQTALQVSHTAMPIKAMPIKSAPVFTMDKDSGMSLSRPPPIEARFPVPQPLMTSSNNVIPKAESMPHTSSSRHERVISKIHHNSHVTHQHHQVRQASPQKTILQAARAISSIETSAVLEPAEKVPETPATKPSVTVDSSSDDVIPSSAVPAPVTVSSPIAVQSTDSMAKLSENDSVLKPGSGDPGDMFISDTSTQQLEEHSAPVDLSSPSQTTLQSESSEPPVTLEEMKPSPSSSNDATVVPGSATTKDEGSERVEEKKEEKKGEVPAEKESETKIDTNAGVSGIESATNERSLVDSSEHKLDIESVLQPQLLLVTDPDQVDEIASLKEEISLMTEEIKELKKQVAAQAALSTAPSTPSQEAGTTKSSENIESPPGPEPQAQAQTSTSTETSSTETPNKEAVPSEEPVKLESDQQPTAQMPQPAQEPTPKLIPVPAPVTAAPEKPKDGEVQRERHKWATGAYFKTEAQTK